MRLEADTWLAGIFERPVFKVLLQADETPSPDEYRARLAECVRDQPSFLYARIPTAQPEHVRTLTRSGFDVVDVAVTFDRSLSAVTTREQRDDSIRVREARPADFDATLAVAERCFTYSRFHLDQRVPRSVANRIKREWIDSYCRGRRGERLIIAETNGTISGFLAVLRATVGQKKASVIDLIGVDARFQRRGIGERLVKEFITSASGVDVLRVGTQAANIPSMRLYQKSGFLVAETAYVLHAHIGGS